MAYSRISARRGSIVNLPVSFFKGGVLSDPLLYRIEIFRGKVAAENIVAAYDIEQGSTYPSPAVQVVTGSTAEVGKYYLPWQVPNDMVVPDIYFDVWYFFSSDPRTGSGSGSDVDTLADHEAELIEVCNKFWVYPDQWYGDGGLENLKFAFEPMDIKFTKPEVRPLEVGITPLPLYDYDYNLVAPIVPFLEATISIRTERDEPIIENAAMATKIRQGAYRTNPFLFSYMMDTGDFFKGTYKYNITIRIPDGSTRVSSTFFFTLY